jgi:predicted CXXCH cytochrome family protein
VLLGLVLLLGLGCAEQTRYRVLSFFFDGVPEPGSEAPTETREELVARQKREQAEYVAGLLETARRKTIVHRPYANYQCAACHDMAQGKMVMTAEEGLCTRCHRDLTSRLRFVHGPVAVNACLECHHPHESVYPALLRAEPTAVCSGCHDPEELSPGEHRRFVASQVAPPGTTSPPGAAPGAPAPPAAEPAPSCLDCHDGHGGDNRMFLKRRNE